ncbi:hypothetical protein MTO96_020906 [Rhipicephalus appendiculatus]
MDTTDTESVEDESEYPQQPYVDIEAVNSTLTEVHQQYNNLLLKYSNALNIIDELKCQLACGIGQGIAGARVESYALGLRRDVHFLENDVRKREPFAPAADKRNSDLVTSRQSGAWRKCPSLHHPPCAYDSSRRGHSSQKKTAAVQPKYHQVAVVYPAQRSAELCTVGCCIAHSCCCCQHTAEHQKSIHHMEAPHSSCCFSAGLDAKLTHLSRKCLCSGTSATPDTALFKVSSALDIALKLATELRKSSSSLLQQL